MQKVSFCGFRNLRNSVIKRNRVVSTCKKSRYRGFLNSQSPFAVGLSCSGVIAVLPAFCLLVCFCRRSASKMADTVKRAIDAQCTSRAD